MLLREAFISFGHQQCNTRKWGLTSRKLTLNQLNNVFQIFGETFLWSPCLSHSMEQIWCQNQTEAQKYNLGIKSTEPVNTCVKWSKKYHREQKIQFPIRNWPKNQPKDLILPSISPVKDFWGKKPDFWGKKVKRIIHKMVTMGAMQKR